MSEANVHGITVWSSSGFDTGIDNRQYALFQLKPEFINSYGTIRFHYWLKDVSSTKGFASIHVKSYSDQYFATGTYGVWARFLIG